MKFVLASQNRGKLREMAAILQKLGVEIVLQADLGVAVDVEETGTTFEENARLKAVAVMKATGLPAIADDSGLCVDALDGAPGVYSARYGGDISDPEKVQLLLKNLEGVTERGAHFATSIVCAFPGGDELTAEGKVYGTIAHAPAGEGGFGYDPVFYYPDFGKTFGEVGWEMKSEVSHRGKALRDFAVKLEEYLK